MTCYATVDFYRHDYGGEFDGEDDALLRLLQLASLKVDQITFGRIGSFGRLTPYQQERVQWATCLQADYIDQHGTADDMGSIGSYSVRDISVSMPSGESRSAMLAQAGISAEAFAALDTTGLTCRRI